MAGKRRKNRGKTQEPQQQQEQQSQDVQPQPSQNVHLQQTQQLQHQQEQQMQQQPPQQQISSEQQSQPQRRWEQQTQHMQQQPPQQQTSSVQQSQRQRLREQQAQHMQQQPPQQKTSSEQQSQWKTRGQPQMQREQVNVWQQRKPHLQQKQYHGDARQQPRQQTPTQQEQPSSGYPLQWQKQPQMQKEDVKGFPQRKPQTGHQPPHQPMYSQPSTSRAGQDDTPASTAAWSSKKNWVPVADKPKDHSSIKKEQLCKQETLKIDEKVVASAKDSKIGVQYKICKPGQAGRKIQVYTNHLEIKLGKVTDVILYDVDITSDRPAKKQWRFAMEMFRRAHFGDCFPAYDGKKLLCSSRDLGDELRDQIAVPVEGGADKHFNVTIKKVAVHNLNDIMRYIHSTPVQGRMEEPRSALQVVDIVLAHTISMNNIPVGRSIFRKPPRPNDIPNGFEIYNGYFQSVTLGSKPLLNVDVTYKAFMKSTKVVDLYNELFERSRLPDRERTASLGRYLRGIKVVYIENGKPSTKRIYTINDAKDPARGLQFDMEGRKLTVQQYYREFKNIELAFAHLPCLWVGNKERTIYVPCEFCTILPNQLPNSSASRDYDADIKRGMIRFSQGSTRERKKRIEDWVQEINYNGDRTVSDFDIKIGNDFERIGARIISPPSLLAETIIPVKRGEWNSNSFYRSEGLHSWTILSLGSMKPADLFGLQKLITTVSKQLNVNISEPIGQPINLNRAYERELREQFVKLKQLKVSIVFVVLSYDKASYARVKLISEITVGCLTQCIKPKTRINLATVKNIMLKVNAKLNGVNHTIEKKPAKMEGTMFMGADVTHPRPGENDPNSTDSRAVPSVAAVTANFDADAFKYSTCWRMQQPKVEIVTDLRDITSEHLRNYKKCMGKLPRRIMYFRDGVGDSQFEEVVLKELPAIFSACAMSGGSEYRPNVTFIMVQKRHHTRFMPVDTRICIDKNLNVPPGTVVDTDIVNPKLQNFYLVSHASLLGVARPTKYVTVWDDEGYTNDELQELTYYLCHMFSRCNRSVSYPAPTYYAHLAASRGKTYLQQEKVDCRDLEREQQRLQIKECIAEGRPMYYV